MLAAAVDAGERLLVQQAGQPVLRGDPLQHQHRLLLMIGRDVGVLVNRSQLVLRRSDFVVPRLDRHAELGKLTLGFQHAGEYSIRDRTEVLIFELLTLRRLGSEECPAADVEVRAREVEVAVDQEVFLLGTTGREDVIGNRLTEDLQDSLSLLIESLH